MEIPLGKGNTLDESIHYHIIQEIAKFKNDPYPHPLNIRVSSITNLWDTIAKHPRPSKYLCAAFLKLNRITILAILDPDWKGINTTLKDSLLKNIQLCCHRLKDIVEKAHDMCQKLLGLANDAWGDRGVDWNKLVYGKLDYEDLGVQTYLQAESDEIILGRIHFLISVDRSHLALSLARYLFIHKNRKRMRDYENMKESFHSAGGLVGNPDDVTAFHSALNWFISLLLRKECIEIVKEAKLLACHDGIQLIFGFQRKGTRKSLFMGTELIKAFLVQDILHPKKYCCTKTLFGLWCSSMRNESLLQVTAAVREFLGPTVRTSAHFYLCADVFYSEFQGAFLPLYVELFIRGLTIDINFLEVARNEKHQRKKLDEIEIHVADMFDKFSSLFSELNEIVERECILSAFSLRPTKKRLYILQSLTHCILSNGQFKSEWEKELNKFDPGCNKYSCGFNCSSVCMRKKKLFHPLLSKGIKNVPYSLVKDFVIVLESVRCNTFQFNYFDWESAVTELGDYLAEHSKKQLQVDYDSDTDCASDESTSPISHRKSEDARASTSGSLQNYSNDRNSAIISTDVDYVGLSSSAVPYVAANIEIETESKSGTEPVSSQDQSISNNAKLDMKRKQQSYSSSFQYENQQHENLVQNYDKFSKNSVKVANVTPHNILPNKSKTHDKIAPLSDQGHSDASYSTSPSTSASAAPQTSKSSLSSYVQKNETKQCVALSSVNQHYLQGSRAQNVSQSTSSFTQPSASTATATSSKPSYATDFRNNSQKKQFVLKSPVTTGDSSSLPLEGLGSPYRLMPSVEITHRMAEKRKIDYSLSSTDKYFAQEPAKSVNEASTAKYLQVRTQNKAVHDKNTVPTEGNMSQELSVKSEILDGLNTSSTQKLNPTFSKSTSYDHSLNPGYSQSGHQSHRPNIAKVSPMINYDQRIAINNALVPLSNDQNQDSSGRNSVIQHTMQVKSPTIEKQVSLSQSSNPGSPISKKISVPSVKEKVKFLNPIRVNLGNSKLLRVSNEQVKGKLLKILSQASVKKEQQSTKQSQGKVERVLPSILLKVKNLPKTVDGTKVSNLTNFSLTPASASVEGKHAHGTLLNKTGEQFSKKPSLASDSLPSGLSRSLSTSEHVKSITHSSPTVHETSSSLTPKLWNDYLMQKNNSNVDRRSVNVSRQQMSDPSPSPTYQSTALTSVTSSETVNQSSLTKPVSSLSSGQKYLTHLTYSHQQQQARPESLTDSKLSLKALLSSPSTTNPVSTNTTLTKSKSSLQNVSTSVSSLPPKHQKTLSSNIAENKKILASMFRKQYVSNTTPVSNVGVSDYATSHPVKRQQVEAFKGESMLSSSAYSKKVALTSVSEHVSNSTPSVSNISSQAFSKQSVPQSTKQGRTKQFIEKTTFSSSMIAAKNEKATPISSHGKHFPNSTNISPNSNNAQHYFNYSQPLTSKLQESKKFASETALVEDDYTAEDNVTILSFQRNYASPSHMSSVSASQSFRSYDQSHSSKRQQNEAVMNGSIPNVPDHTTMSPVQHNTKASPLISKISSPNPYRPSSGSHISSVPHRNPSPLNIRDAFSPKHSFSTSGNTSSVPSYSVTNRPSSNQVQQSFNSDKSRMHPSQYNTGNEPSPKSPFIINACMLSPSHSITSRQSPNSGLSFHSDRNIASLSPYNTPNRPSSNPMPPFTSDRNSLNPSPYNHANRPSPNSTPSSFNSERNVINPSPYSTVNRPSPNSTPSSFSNDRNIMNPSPYSVTNRPSPNSTPSSFSSDRNIMDLSPYNTSRLSSNPTPPSFASDRNIMNLSPYKVTNKTSPYTTPPCFNNDGPPKRCWPPEPPQSSMNSPAMAPSSMCCSPHEVQKCQTCKQPEKNQSSLASVSSPDAVSSETPGVKSFHDETPLQHTNPEEQARDHNQIQQDVLSPKKKYKKPPVKCNYCGKYLGTLYTLKQHIFNIHSGQNKRRRKRNSSDNSISPSSSQMQPFDVGNCIVKTEPLDDYEMRMNQKSTRDQNQQQQQFEAQDELDKIFDQYSTDNTSFNEKLLDYLSDFSGSGLPDSQAFGEPDANLAANETLPYLKTNVPAIPDQSVFNPADITNNEQIPPKPYDNTHTTTTVSNPIPEEPSNNMALEPTTYNPDSELQSSWQVAGAAMRYLNDSSYANADEQFFSDFPTSFDPIPEEASFKNGQGMPNNTYSNSTQVVPLPVSSSDSTYPKSMVTAVDNFQINDFLPDSQNSGLMENRNWQHIEPKYFQQKCSICEQTFASEQELKMHVDSIHGDIAQITEQPFYAYDNVYSNNLTDVANLKPTSGFSALEQQQYPSMKSVSGPLPDSELKMQSAILDFSNNSNNLCSAFDNQSKDLAMPNPCSAKSYDNLSVSLLSDDRLSATSLTQSDSSSMLSPNNSASMLSPNNSQTCVCEMCGTKFYSYNIKQVHMEQVHGVHLHDGKNVELNQPFGMRPETLQTEMNCDFNDFNTSQFSGNSLQQEASVNNVSPSFMPPFDKDSYSINRPLPMYADSSEYIPTHSYKQTPQMNDNRTIENNLLNRSAHTNSPILASVLSSHLNHQVDVRKVKIEPFDEAGNYHGPGSTHKKTQMARKKSDSPKGKRASMNLGLSCPMCIKKLATLKRKENHMRQVHKIQWIESSEEFEERKFKEKQYSENKLREKMLVNSGDINENMTQPRLHSNDSPLAMNRPPGSLPNKKRKVWPQLFKEVDNKSDTSAIERNSSDLTKDILVSSINVRESPHPMPILSPVTTAATISASSSATSTPHRMPEIDMLLGHKSNDQCSSPTPNNQSKCADFDKDKKSPINVTLNAAHDDSSPQFDDSPPVSKMLASTAKGNNVFEKETINRKPPTENMQKLDFANTSKVPCKNGLFNIPSPATQSTDCGDAPSKAIAESSCNEKDTLISGVKEPSPASPISSAPSCPIPQPHRSFIIRDQFVVSKISGPNKNSVQNRVQFNKKNSQLLPNKEANVLMNQSKPPYIIRTSAENFVRPRLGFQNPTVILPRLEAPYNLKAKNMPIRVNLSELQGIGHKENENSPKKVTATSNTESAPPKASTSGINKTRTSKGKRHRVYKEKATEKSISPAVNTRASFKPLTFKMVDIKNIKKEPVEESEDVENSADVEDTSEERSDGDNVSEVCPKIVLKKVKSSSNDSKFQCYVPKKKQQRSVESSDSNSSVSSKTAKTEIVHRTRKCVVKLNRLKIAEKGVITRDKIEQKPLRSHKKKFGRKAKKKGNPSKSSKVKNNMPPPKLRSKRKVACRKVKAPELNASKVLIEKVIPDQSENRELKRTVSVEEITEIPKRKRKRSGRNVSKPVISRKDRRRSYRLREGSLLRKMKDSYLDDENVALVITLD